MTNDAIALEVRNITKRFPGVLANDRVNFDLRKGEIPCLAGREWRWQDHPDEHHLWALHSQ